MQQQSTILARILSHKREEVLRQKAKIGLAALERRIAQRAATRDFAAALRRPPATALIAEVKRASPSRGILIEPFDHLVIAQTYVANGAAALSVLTDQRFFKGSLKYLESIRALPSIETRGVPLLRKDFILDAYQLFEARAYGADAALLIVSALRDAELRELMQIASDLGLATLVEVHTVEEAERALALGVKVLGVNNRDLHTFQTRLETTAAIAALLPDGPERPVLVSESGIFSAEHVAQVRAWGAEAILVGEALVTAADMAAQTQLLASA